MQAWVPSSSSVRPWGEKRPILSPSTQCVWMPLERMVRVWGSSAEPVKVTGVETAGPGPGFSCGVHDARTNDKRTTVPVCLKESIMIYFYDQLPGRGIPEGMSSV